MKTIQQIREAVFGHDPQEKIHVNPNKTLIRNLIRNSFTKMVRIAFDERGRLLVGDANKITHYDMEDMGRDKDTLFSSQKITIPQYGFIDDHYQFELFGRGQVDLATKKLKTDTPQYQRLVAMGFKPKWKDQYL